MVPRAHRLPLASWLALLALMIGLALSIPAASQVSQLQYATYLGGSGRDVGYAVAAGPDGTSYIAGITRSPDFLQLTGPFEGPPPEEYGTRLFVLALDAQGHLLYSTSITSAPDPYALEPTGIAVGPDGSAYVSYTLYGDDWFFGYAVRISPSGEILYRHGLPGYSAPQGIAVDDQGNVYVAGYIETGQYGPSPTFLGRAAFVTKFPANAAQGFQIYFDGSGEEQANAVALDAEGNVYLTGFTDSPDFPSSSPVQRRGEDAFVIRIDPESGEALYVTELGGSGDDRGTDVTVDPQGNVFVTGTTTSPHLPLTGPHQPPASGSNFFLTRLSATGDPVSSRYVGPIPLWRNTSAPAISLGPEGDVFWMGFLANIPPEDPSGLFCEGTAILRFDPDRLGLLDHFCYFTAIAEDIDIDPDGYLYITGWALDDFTTTPGALQPFHGGWVEAFAAKLLLNRSPDCSNAKPSSSTLWPPSGKLVSVALQGVTDPDGDPVTLKITGIRQDEPLSRNGEPDAIGLGAPIAQVRADRKGGGDGRVYHLSFEAQDDKGAACTGTVKVCVPHNQRPGAACGDGGPLFDSTAK